MVTSDPDAEHRYVSSGRIVVIGDVHGHYDGLVDILRSSEFVDDNLDWVAGSATLVQMGDLFGRGDQAVPCAQLMMKLQDQAVQAGGRVHVLLGNHEALMTHQITQYVPLSELVQFARSSIDDCDVHDVFRKGMSVEHPLGRWVRSLPGAVIVDDYLFVHAGLEWSWAEFGLDWLNRRTAEAMATDEDYRDLPRSCPICSPTGPLWNRRFVMDGYDLQAGRDLEATLYELQASAMIIGHTPSVFIPGEEGGKIVRRFDDKLIAIDVGINPIYGGYCGWLEIEDGRPVERYSLPQDRIAVAAG